MSFIKKIIYFVLTLQERILTHNLSKTINAKHKKGRKKYYTNGCYATFDSLAENEKQNIEDEILLILKNADYSTDALLKYIQNQGTKVFYINNANLLNSVQENEGFILPQKGLKALYLLSLTKQALSFKSAEMFIITHNKPDLYMFLYHFYNWYAFKHNIVGMDYDSQKLLKKYFNNSSDEEIDKLQLSEIYQLKDAIKQDKASIEFVYKLCQKLESAQKALQKLNTEGQIEL